MKMIKDFLLFDRKLRLKYYFHKDEEEIENPNEIEDRDTKMKTLYIQAQDGPPVRTEPIFRSLAYKIKQFIDFLEQNISYNKTSFHQPTCWVGLHQV